MTGLLLVDGLYLAAAMYATGGAQSPIRFLVYLQLVAVSLLASYRTGLKMALWDSLLLFVLLYAQAAQLMPAVDVQPGVAIEFEQMPVLNVTAFWLFAIATSFFSALNERELRQRRADLQALVEVGARLDAVADAIQQADIVLGALVTRFGFERAALLGESDGRVVVLATHGTADAPTTPSDPDWIVRRAWKRREILPVKQLDPERDPYLAELMPDARNILVAPMIVEAKTVGAIVVEHRARRRTGVERRVAAMLGQFASIAGAEPAQCRAPAARAGSRRARLAHRRGEPPHVHSSRSSGSSAATRSDRGRIASPPSCSSTSTTSRSSTTRSGTPPATSSSSR